jgi:hypothetical protein
MTDQDDATLAEFETRGPGRKRVGHPRLSSHTPVRFDPDTIAAIRQFSDEDGVTVSAWVRRVVNREIQRRVSLRSRTISAQVVAFSYEHQDPQSTTSAATEFHLDLRPAV